VAFHFFTGASPVEVIGTKSRLVSYISLSAIFTAPINNVGVRFHLLCPMLLRAFAFYFVRSCYFRCACFAHAWFVLNLLPVRELPLSRLSIHRWFGQLLPLHLQSIGSPWPNSQIHLLLMIKVSSRWRLLLIKMLGPMRRIYQETQAIAEMPPITLPT
jgi:hypothetical protein